MTRYLTLTAALFGAVAATASLPAMAAGKSVCLQTQLIDHTEVPNDNTILFYMRGHKLYKADLINKCVGLSINSRGFSYTPTIPGSNEICSNLLTIRLNDTGQTCLVGEITPVEKAAQAQ
ncbi:MAG TPA: hypothetical protein VH722_04690 [Alphaproteobacteria bacterium]|jgi:hypothetical protein|nr:hypothetical protein [Alphaproteobacteria bacterium]